MEGAELELERRSKFLNSLIEKKRAKEQQEQHNILNVRVRAADMPVLLQDRAFRCARDQLDSMPGKLDSKRLALALKKEFDATYGPAWHCIVGTSFGSYVTHSTGGFLYFSIDKDLSILPSFVSHLSAGREGRERGAEPGPPNEALFFVLACLNVVELLAMSEVCTSLRDVVNKDVLPWLDIIIESPLNLRLSDEILIRITSKANGRLRILTLINCDRITDDGLQRVIEKNPFITKLHIPGCSGLTPEGIIGAVKRLSHSLKSLRIDGMYNLEKEHLESIYFHLRMNPAMLKQQGGLLYNQRPIPSTSRIIKSSRMIDVDICPKCSQVRLVYDCPRESSGADRKRLTTHCRGCRFCIRRCEECGRCVDGEELEEAICLDILCTDCWLSLPKCKFCNRAYCKEHAKRLCSSSESAGFLCELCDEKLEYYRKLGQ